MSPDGSLSGLVRRLRPRAVASAVAFAFAIALGSWFFGADAWHAILVGVAVATLGWIASNVSLTLGDGEDESWPVSERQHTTGARNDVLVLSESLRGRHGRVDRGALTPVREIARRRLARCGLQLDDPADREQVRRLIGRRSYRVLVPGRLRPRPPSLRSLETCLDTLEALDTSHIHPRSLEPHR